MRLAQIACAILVRVFRWVTAAAAVVLASGIAGCAAPGVRPLPCAGAGKPVAVAAENTWGSILAQVAGDRMCVASIVSNPATDPHAYEVTPIDARLVAGASYFVENGAGYDPWAAKLVAASPDSKRAVLDVGRLTGVSAAGNPHLWYSPGAVATVVDRMALDLGRVDPAGAAGYAQRAADYATGALAEYHAALERIARRHAGTPIAASESLVAYLADAARLTLVTPAGFLRAVAEGTDPTPADRATAQRQLDGGEVKVFVVNGQNATRDVQTLIAHAAAHGVPVVTVTETLSPANATFQDWQTRQLNQLLDALGG